MASGRKARSGEQRLSLDREPHSGGMPARCGERSSGVVQPSELSGIDNVTTSG